MQQVAVLGASAKPERYSYQAVALLKAAGHAVYPVHPALETLQGLRVYHRLSEIPQALDTITVYLSPQHSSGLADAIVAARPRRVILNPGAENPDLARDLADAGIAVVEACTLVLLRTGQFDVSAG
ncbi:MAG: CoA-binding protein [Lentisphaerae bacterium]|nr:CoA-binding protein [Lentisphaerota bacterium]